MKEPLLVAGIGNPWGRNAIYLDEIIFEGARKVTLKGEFNGTLCSEVNSPKYIEYKITFFEVMFYQSTELDLYEGTHSKEYTSSFEEFIDSELIMSFKRIRSRKIDNYRHFIFWTYDDVIEVVANDYKVEIIKERNKNSS